MTSKVRNKKGQPQRNIYVNTRKHKRFLDMFPKGTPFTTAVNKALDEYITNHHAKWKKERDLEREYMEEHKEMYPKMYEQYLEEEKAKGYDG